VGIAGEQTGIYPQASLGGWWLIGRTPLRLFDPLREPPCLLAPGDRLRFAPIQTPTSPPFAAFLRRSTEENRLI
jgi:allophanate hydrolase subunit 1